MTGGLKNVRHTFIKSLPAKPLVISTSVFYFSEDEMANSITVWNGKEERQVKSFRSVGRLHLIRENGQYDVVRHMPDKRLIYLTSNTGWKRSDYDRYFDYAVDTDDWVNSCCEGDAPVFLAPESPDDFFIEGAKVHYGNAETWLALCGSGWLNASTDPEKVTCMECLSLLEQQQAPAPANEAE